jgi:DNA uptake protein ComE-like DNA-binding protein
MNRRLSFLGLATLVVALTAPLAQAQTSPAGTPTDQKAAPAASASHVTTVKAPAKHEPKVHAAPASAARREMLDLNTASREDLARLPGIGDTYSDKIIAGRPYRSRSELMSKKILPKATYEKIRSMVTARQAEAKKS